jgi:hypothetical protein
VTPAPPCFCDAAIDSALTPIAWQTHISMASSVSTKVRQIMALTNLNKAECGGSHYVDDWGFYRHAEDGLWSWRNTQTESTSASFNRLPTFSEAMSHAIQHVQQTLSSEPQQSPRLNATLRFLRAAISLHTSGAF